MSQLASMRLPRWLHLIRRERSETLSRRQLELVALAAVQRREVDELQAHIRASSLWLETGLGVVRSIAAHPQVVMLSLLATSMSFGKGMSLARSWTLRGLALHQLYRVMGSGLLKLFHGKPEQDPAAH